MPKKNQQCLSLQNFGYGQGQFFFKEQIEWADLTSIIRFIEDVVYDCSYLF